MKKDNIDNLFKNLEGSFDLEAPAQGHEQRFLEKLNAQQGTKSLQTKNKTWWKPLFIAASIAIVCAITFGVYQSTPSLEQQVAEISPEVSRTEFYFTSLIEEQVNELKNESTPETKKIVEDTMVQLKKLETNYTKLEQDLINGGNSKLLLSAMITNFQTRIDLLQEVLNTIESIKNLKNYDNAETTI
ncbi:hypothetical protein [Zobellia barbeyronii]|uniref:DUF4179 domain-containing protein n=1 Tax=Zobellia barbeyronii TaxID=2748009 RepID=A0ABS5WFQ2_9FLAO|nr:hypothetical protein [Zobellia barbeyronii]MBT2161680.1 hypothetical protein [Zobellia barbeyronii]